MKTAGVPPVVDERGFATSAGMRYLSPLRYPGGKARLAPFLKRVLAAQTPCPPVYGEPFAGGAGAGLKLLVDGHIERLLINDINPGIAAFWRCVVGTPDELCTVIRQTPVTLDEWHHQREVYIGGDVHDDVALGFATFFLNRTNRSGILDARPIGGLDQAGRWKLDARYNKEDLVARVSAIAQHREAITVAELDALDFLDGNAGLGEDVFMYVDPPYLHEGGQLYRSQFDIDAHKALSERLKVAPFPWILSYDDDARIYEEMYHGCRIGRFEMGHTANRQHVGTELIVFSDSVHVPDLQLTPSRPAVGVSSSSRYLRLPRQCRPHT